MGMDHHTASENEDWPAGMTFVPGGTFRMGSDHHYPEEAPSHLVTVDSVDAGGGACRKL